ncbi:GlsB/YeaQ/YmgE family stress response membrane protein [Parafrankia elaeagni]|uniref:GlsB/YeaQ/YmgE family stress response membrane protein n=1 Tax=Parafrankia elaeagni TaxID=222534 RepID=UPI0003A22916|nr:GlsB/YeaQ/YmgE family stress response membrane protein [Parafrankia elaeagni]
MFQILWIVLAGLIIGVLARFIARAVGRGRQDIPLWLTVAIGIVGALVGNVIASAIGVRNTSGFDWIRHVLQIGVAVALVGIAAPLWASRQHRHHDDRYGVRH